MNGRVLLAGCLLLLSQMGVATAAPGAGGQRNDIPSCRTLYFKESPQPHTLRDYFIVVDRTVKLPESLTQDSIARAVRAIRPGDHVELITFSGDTASEFTYMQLSLWVDAPVTEDELENKIPASRMAVTRQCFAKQLAIGRVMAQKQLVKLLGEPLTQAKRSEILKALTGISHDLVQPGPVHDKVVLVISDMVEYSDVASFYAGKALRVIKPEAVLQSAQSAGLIGTFSGARIYVQGAAAASGPQARVGLKERQALHGFWDQWFSKSGGSLAGWGEPALLTDIQ